jgi:Flp pilus assembly protein TadD
VPVCKLVPTLLFALLAGCVGPLPVAPDSAALTATERAAYGSALQAFSRAEPQAALTAVSPLTELQPWYVPAHVVYQDALVELGHRDEVSAWYRAQAELESGDAAHVLLAARLDGREAGRREQGYRRAFELDSASPWPAVALVYELTRVARDRAVESVRLADTGYPVEAAETEERAREVQRETEAILAQLLAAHADLADVQAAAANSALTVAVATGARDSLHIALEHAERATQLDPGTPRWFALLARVRRELIDDAGAETALRQALDLDPDDPLLLASLGRVLLDRGRPEEARDALALATSALPDDAIIATDLGVAYHRTRAFDLAVAELGRVDPRPLEALALVELEIGDAAAAAAAVHEYLRRGGSDRSSAERILRELQRDVELPAPQPLRAP